MFEVKILKERNFGSVLEFEKNISFYLNKGFEVKEFNTIVKNDKYSESIVLLIKEKKRKEG